jgi:hypothetical protein
MADIGDNSRHQASTAIEPIAVITAAMEPQSIADITAAVLISIARTRTCQDPRDPILT